MILCIGTTPAAQRVMVFNQLTLDSVNRAATTLDGIAGKSINVAKVLQTLGEKPLAIGFLGGTRGDEIRQALHATRIETDFIGVAASTRQCITVIDESAGSITELVEESQPLQLHHFQELTVHIQQHAKRCRGMVMSGTIARGGPDGLYRQCIELGRAARALCIVDAQGAALEEALKARPHVIKPNRQELARTLARELGEEREVLSAMREMRARGAEKVIVTAGRDAALALEERSAWRIHPPKVHALNSIGSGDAFTAALTSRLLRGDDLGEACRWGAAAGAANALSLMPGDLGLQDVERLAAETRVERL